MKEKLDWLQQIMEIAVSVLAIASFFIIVSAIVVYRIRRPKVAKVRKLFVGKSGKLTKKEFTDVTESFWHE